MGRKPSGTFADSHKREGDLRTFEVTSAKGVKYTVTGERDARIIAGKDGTYQQTKEA